MRNKLILCTVALASWGCWTPLQAQVKMVFYAHDGSKLEASLDQVRTLKMQPQGFEVNSKDHQVLATYKYSDLKKICFESQMTGIDPVTSVTQQLKVSISHRVLTVQDWPAGTAATVAVYAMTGQCVYRKAQWTGEDISLAGMPAGVYLLQVNHQTVKFVLS